LRTEKGVGRLGDRTYSVNTLQNVNLVIVIIIIIRWIDSFLKREKMDRQRNYWPAECGILGPFD